MRLPPRSEEFGTTAEERSVTTERRAGLTGSGARANRQEESDWTGRRSDPRKETSRKVQEWKRRREGPEAPSGKCVMATFLTDMIKKGYIQDEIFAVIFESEREKKHKRMQANVTETVNAHRLEKMRELLALEKQATFRRMNGFDRDVDR